MKSFLSRKSFLFEKSFPIEKKSFSLYNRAEILYRCNIPPFTQSRSVLEPLTNGIKTEDPDILELCHSIPKEVLSLGGGKGVGGHLITPVYCILIS